MSYLDFNFDELLGIFFGFTFLTYLTTILFSGFIRLFDKFIGAKIKRVFHYHYHYKDRRK